MFDRDQDTPIPLAPDPATPLTPAAPRSPVLAVAPSWHEPDPRTSTNARSLGFAIPISVAVSLIARATSGVVS